MAADEFIPTPYPLDDPRWDFSRALGGTDAGFSSARANGMCRRAIISPRSSWRASLGEPVTVFDRESATLPQSSGSARAARLDSLRMLERRLPYRDYLAEMARHRIVFQADRSAVPGQVAGDALLCRHALRRRRRRDRSARVSRDLRPWAFVRRIDRTWQRACSAIRKFYSATVAASQELARERVSYTTVADRELAQFFGKSGRSLACSVESAESFSPQWLPERFEIKFLQRARLRRLAQTFARN